MYPDQLVLDFFSLEGPVVKLNLGEGRTFKAGNTILKHVNRDSRKSTQWLIDLALQTEEKGFRISKPLPSINGTYISDFGWTAWTFLSGNHDYTNKIAESVEAIIAFHKEVKGVTRPSFMVEEDNPYRRADRLVFGELKLKINEDTNPVIQRLVERLSFVDLEVQLIHGDLNPENIILLDGEYPGIIDITPYFRPIEFALAVYAYWIGPFKEDFVILDYFADIDYFDQMMYRAALRMILIKQEFGTLDENSRELFVAENILKHYKR